MSKQRRFTTEFVAEVVRLAETSSRTQREIAQDLGIGLSMLVCWISRSRGTGGSTILQRIGMKIWPLS